MLANGVRPVIFYYNPNIFPREEYEIRKQESKRHAESLGVRWIDGDYNHDEWLGGICGLEGEPERGRRCERCFFLRLKATALKAQELGIPYFTTTLASSRWKDIEQINRAGREAELSVHSSQFIVHSSNNPSPNCQLSTVNYQLSEILAPKLAQGRSLRTSQPTSQGIWFLQPTILWLRVQRQKLKEFSPLSNGFMTKKDHSP